MGCSGHSGKGNSGDDFEGAGCFKRGYHRGFKVGEVEELIAAFCNSPFDPASFMANGDDKPARFVLATASCLPNCAFRDQIRRRFLSLTEILFMEGRLRWTSSLRP